METSPRRTKLAELLAQQRLKKGMTQAEVARALKRYQPFIANIESGQRRVDVVELLELAEVIGLDVSKLIRELMKLPR